ncbi:uncharacterized protein LOC116172160 [Photinus pyralis]|nr:uncharacterized protein LOC116172160 [Photinus pyralis]
MLHSLPFLAFVAIVASRDPPQSLTRCYIDDPNLSECIKNAALEAQPLLRKGIEEYGIPSFFPLILKNFQVNHQSHDANFTVRATDLKIYGMDLYSLSDVRFCPKKPKLKGKLWFGNLHIFSNYVMNGHTINLPIVGEGFYKSIVSPSTINFEITGQRVNGDVTLESVKLDFQVDKMWVQFDGLVTGEGPWGNTNEVLAESEEAVAKALSPVFGKVFETYVTKYMRWLLEEIPFSTIFPCCINNSTTSSA